MIDIIFASNNANKATEIRAFINDKLTIKTLQEVGITEDIEEPYNTFEENAWAKAMYVYKKTGKPCFAEDSGLVVPALQGAPGVLSARYAGQHGNDSANNAKLLANMATITDRAAYYKAVICLVMDEQTIHYFDGQCNGHIAMESEGNGGFGYDPLFIPNGYEHTFGLLGMDVKKKNSHRSQAVAKLSAFFNINF